MTTTVPATLTPAAPATPPSRHPSGITLIPTAWRVEIAGREIGTFSILADIYSGYHSRDGRGHVAAWTSDLTEAISQILACDRDPARCAQAQAAQDAADKQQRELRAAREVA